MSESYSGTGVRQAYGALAMGTGAGGLSVAASHASGVVRLYTGGNGAGNERLRVDAAGNVGIGTTTPPKKLDVNGDINVSGNINAKYQDFAEWVDAAEPLPAGTVVTISAAHVNTVIASTRAYDTAVAGVVSAQPGILLGEEGPDKAKVATTGRVKVRVDASASPIAVGDLLVTSDRPGIAMKSQPITRSATRSFIVPAPSSARLSSRCRQARARFSSF